MKMIVTNARTATTEICEEVSYHYLHILKGVEKHTMLNTTKT
jgi:hypothetical protein